MRTRTIVIREPRRTRLLFIPDTRYVPLPPPRRHAYPVLRTRTRTAWTVTVSPVLMPVPRAARKVERSIFRRSPVPFFATDLRQVPLPVHHVRSESRVIWKTRERWLVGTVAVLVPIRTPARNLLVPVYRPRQRLQPLPQTLTVPVPVRRQQHPARLLIRTRDRWTLSVSAVIVPVARAARLRDREVFRPRPVPFFAVDLRQMPLPVHRIRTEQRVTYRTRVHTVVQTIAVVTSVTIPVPAARRHLPPVLIRRPTALVHLASFVDRPIAFHRRTVLERVVLRTRSRWLVSVVQSVVPLPRQARHLVSVVPHRGKAPFFAIDLRHLPYRQAAHRYIKSVEPRYRDRWAVRQVLSFLPVPAPRRIIRESRIVRVPAPFFGLDRRDVPVPLLRHRLATQTVTRTRDRWITQVVNVLVYSPLPVPAPARRVYLERRTRTSRTLFATDRRDFFFPRSTRQIIVPQRVTQRVPFFVVNTVNVAVPFPVLRPARQVTLCVVKRAKTPFVLPVNVVAPLLMHRVRREAAVKSPRIRQVVIIPIVSPSAVLVVRKPARVIHERARGSARVVVMQTPATPPVFLPARPRDVRRQVFTRRALLPIVIHALVPIRSPSRIVTVRTTHTVTRLLPLRHDQLLFVERRRISVERVERRIREAVVAAAQTTLILPAPSRGRRDVVRYQRKPLTSAAVFVSIQSQLVLQFPKRIR